MVHRATGLSSFKRKWSKWAALVTAIGVFTVIGVVSVAGQRGQARPETPPQSPRAVTPEERAHALLHDRGFENKPRLTQTVAIFVPIAKSGPGAPSYESFLHAEVCAADLVVQGVAVSSHSMLNSSETFVFTDTVVNPEIIYRSKQQQGQGAITVTRLGGDIVLDGQKISAGYVNDPVLLRGHRYILFLQSLSGGRDYESRPHLSQVEDQGRQVVFAPLGKWSPQELFFRTFRFADVQDDVKKAVASCH